MFKSLMILLALATPVMAVDEYILPDADNFVDLRHVKRATCSVVYYSPAYVTFKEGGGPGVGGDSGYAQGLGSGIGGQIGGFLGGNIGSRIGSFIGGAIGFNLSITGGGKPPSPVFHHEDMRALGFGVVYAETAEHYYILTAGHCIIRKPYIQFNYAGERSNYIPADVMLLRKGQGYQNDLAVLRIEKWRLFNYNPPTIMPLPTDSQDIVVRGHSVVTIRFGSITHTKIIKRYPDTYQIDAQIHKGMSGSPVMDKTGRRLVGIVLSDRGTCISHFRITEILNEHNDWARAQNVR